MTGMNMTLVENIVSKLQKETKSIKKAINTMRSDLQSTDKIMLEQHEKLEQKLADRFNRILPDNVPDAIDDNLLLAKSHQDMQRIANQLVLILDALDDINDELEKMDKRLPSKRKR